jgi:hypothetical protein
MQGFFFFDIQKSEFSEQTYDRKTLFRLQLEPQQADSEQLRYRSDHQQQESQIG